MRLHLLGCTAALLACSVVHAQNFSTSPCPNNNDSGSGWFSQEHACELRRTTLPLTGGHLGVTGNNGEIEVVGEDRSDIALEVKVTAQASSRSDAEALLHQVRIVTNGSDIRADGPHGGDSGFFSRRSWTASFRLHVPRRVANTDLTTSNGGIHVDNLEGQVTASTNNGGIEAMRVRGNLRASTTNGGLRLEDLGGAVHAETTNGGVHISLAGDRWHGDGLFAKSTNGGITVKSPEHFAAHLVADTTNGGISVGFPMTVQGKIGHHLDTDVNGGGPPVHLETTNGGITIDRL